MFLSLRCFAAFAMPRTRAKPGHVLSSASANNGLSSVFCFAPLRFGIEKSLPYGHLVRMPHPIMHVKQRNSGMKRGAEIALVFDKLMIVRLNHPRPKIG